jgi:ABC-type molybdenum transport system ATPase subunit/photorepair protein PhrA
MSRARAENPTFSVTLKRIDLDRGERTVLRDVNWRIQSGQRWLLVGRQRRRQDAVAEVARGQRVAETHGRELRRYRFRGEAFDTPAGVAEEIAYVGAERQDRYEHYDWNFRVHDVVGHRRTAHRHSHARAHCRRTAWSRGPAQAPRHRRARRATISHPVLR